jgi:AcrR family transcriptional regulator
MPYPAKTSPREILDEAMAQVERGGANRLSVRAVAAALGLAPNALYRYYADRDALLAAVADEGARLLLAAVEDATRGREGADAVRSLAAAYLGFARTRPALYATVMVQHAFPAGSRPAHEDLWDFATGLLGDVAGERTAEATVAVWGLLHGAAGLDQAGLFGERKPGGGGVDFGLEALLEGMARS